MLAASARVGRIPTMRPMSLVLPLTEDSTAPQGLPQPGTTGHASGEPPAHAWD